MSQTFHSGHSMFRLMPSSLRARLLLFVLLAVLPALGLTLYSAMEQRAAAAADAHADALRLARVMAHDHAKNLESARLLLSNISRLPAVRDADPQQCPALLSSLLQGEPQYTNFGVFSAPDRLICSARPITPREPASADLTSTALRAIESGRLSSSRFGIGGFSGRPKITVALRIGDRGDLRNRVMYAGLSLDWLNTEVHEAHLPSGSTLTVVDELGTVLVRHPDPKRWIGAPFILGLPAPRGERVFTASEPDGVRRLYASTPLSGADGHSVGQVLVGIPASVAFARADQVLRRNLLWLTLLALATGALAWFGSELLVLRPVNAMLSATRRLQAGDHAARTGRTGGKGELDQLAHAFDDMAATLERRHEELLRAANSLRQQALVFDTIAEGVMVMKPDGTILDWNPGAEQMFGYAREEILGKGPLVLRPGMESVRDEINARLATEGRWSGELPFVRKDGSEGISDMVVVAQHDADGQCIAHIGVNRDITDRKRAEAALRQSEEQLRQAQKMDAMGRLAGGVAHDFNNLLTAIKGNAELLLLNLPDTSPLRPELEQIDRATDTAASLTRQLLAFSRQQTPGTQVVDPARVVEGVSGLLRRLVGARVELVTEQEPSPPIRIDPAQLEQVLLNLTVNASDAMPEGGRLSIRTGSVELAPDHPLRPPHLAPGEYVMLTVHDTGVGMDAETRQRVFEPFFTTKGAGRGTGLGLFTVYGIVRQSGGHVSVQSEPGAGATFRVLFPRADAEAAAETSLPREELARGRETVLLAEDELPVRIMVQRFLERLGYQVLAAADGEAALQLSAAHPGKIHLLLTDMTMPRMGGRELALRLAETRPDARIIIMSGYTEEELPPTPAGSAPVRFVHKPFSLSVLANALRDVLDDEERHEVLSA